MNSVVIVAASWALFRRKTLGDPVIPRDRQIRSGERHEDCATSMDRTGLATGW